MVALNSSKNSSPSVSAVGRGHDGLALAEALGVELGVDAAQARAQHRAELPGAPQAHDELVAEGRGVRGHELAHEHALDVLGHRGQQGLTVELAEGLGPGLGVGRHGRPAKFSAHSHIMRRQVARTLAGVLSTMRTPPTSDL